MTTRQEQFEIDRKKMMGQMSADEESIEVEDVEMSDDTIGEPNPNWSDEQKEDFEAYKEDLLDDYEESMAVNLRDPEEYRKREAKKQQKKIWSEWVTKTLLNFEDIIMKIATPFFVLFSLTIWYQENAICAIVIFVALWFSLRVVLFSFALTIIPLVEQSRKKHS